MKLDLQKLSYSAQRPGGSSERIGLDVKSLQDRDKELRERELLSFDFASPTGIANDSSTGLIVFIPFAELEVSAIS